MKILAIRVKNPFALRTALEIALEATRADLHPEYRDYLRDFTRAVPARTQPPFDLMVGEDGAQPLRLLSGYFRHTKTCEYLPAHLRVALLDVLVPLQKGDAP